MHSQDPHGNQVLALLLERHTWEIDDLAGTPERLTIEGGRSLETAARLAQGLKDWLKTRPRLEIEESATWFLLLFAYAHGLTADDLGFRMAGIIPQLTAPQFTLAMGLYCLIVSVVVLIEPLLPCEIRARTRRARCSSLGQYLRGISVFFAFVLGMATGFSLIVDRVPTLSWLLVPVAYVGIVISVAMGIKLFVFAGGYWDTGRPGEDSCRKVTL